MGVCVCVWGGGGGYFFHFRLSLWMTTYLRMRRTTPPVYLTFEKGVLNMIDRKTVVVKRAIPQVIFKQDWKV